MTTATRTAALHDIIRMERTYKATTARVFEAWRDVQARERWSRPSPEVEIIYDQAEFKVGGLDIVQCGARGGPRFVAYVRYMEILPDARIVMSESVAEDGKSRAVSLITVEFEAQGAATHLTVTMQVAALEHDMVDGYRVGWTAALDNLRHEFEV